MNFRSEVSSCASRPIEAMMWLSEIESSKSIANLKTSYSITRAELQTAFGVLGSKNGEWSQEDHSADFTRIVFSQEEAAQKAKRPSHGKARRMDDL